MADFCTKCAPQMWGEPSQPDIDIDAIYESLQPGDAISVLCEGCILQGIGKTTDGEMLLAIPNEVDHSSQLLKSIKWVNREEFMSTPTKI